VGVLLLLLMAGCLLAPPSAGAKTLKVKIDGTGDYLTIRDAVEAAKDGDTVEIHPGFYYGPENLNSKISGKKLFIKGIVSGDLIAIPEQFTRAFPQLADSRRLHQWKKPVICGQLAKDPAGEALIFGIFGTYRAFWIENAEVELEDLIIYRTSLLAADPSADNEGGAILVEKGSEVEIRDFEIRETIAATPAGVGGGIALLSSSRLLMENSVVNACGSTLKGGGVALLGGSQATLVQSAIDGGAGKGGGVFVSDGSLYLSQCQVHGQAEAKGQSPDQCAGGGLLMENSGGVIINSTFSGCGARGYGAGVALKHSSPFVTDCVFYRNEAWGGGGALAMWDDSRPALHKAIVVENTCGKYDRIGHMPLTAPIPNLNGGGVLALASFPKISTSFFGQNGATGQGGGVMLTDSAAVLQDCIFMANGALMGGGLASIGRLAPTNELPGIPPLDIYRCAWVWNGAADPSGLAEGCGGGMLVVDGIPHVDNSFFAQNFAVWGGGAAIKELNIPLPERFRGQRYKYPEKSELRNCTFRENVAAQGGGAVHYTMNIGWPYQNYYYLHHGIANSIFWGNDDAYSNQIYTAGATVYVDSSNVQNGPAGVHAWTGGKAVWGAGNMAADPLFGNGVVLSSASPCRNAGDSSLVWPGETDIQGKARISGPAVDIGAYELPPSLSEYARWLLEHPSVFEEMQPSLPSSVLYGEFLR